MESLTTVSTATTVTALAQAFFLETWRRGSDCRWRLARHTAEKL